MTSRREWFLSASMGLTTLAGCRRSVIVVSIPAQARGAVVNMENTAWVCPRWSPNGRSVAFLARDLRGRDRLCLANSSLRGFRFLGPPETEGAVLPRSVGRATGHAPDDFCWMPSGMEIVLPRVETFEFPDGDRLRGAGLWLCDVAVHSLTRAATHPSEYDGSRYVYRTPRPSPDGRLIAFTGDGLAEPPALGLVAPGRAPSVIERLHYDPRASVDCAAWSPDGKRLAVRRRLVRSHTADPLESIRLLHPGAPVSCVEIPVEHGRVEGIVWSPDSKQVCVTIVQGEGRSWRSHAETLDLSTQKWSGNLVPESDRTFATDWLDAKTPCVLATTAKGYSVFAVPFARGRTRQLANLPSDDFDWSPDRTRIAVSDGRRIRVISVLA